MTDKTFNDALKQLLHENGDHKLEEVARRLIELAMEGDVKAAQLLMERVDGKVAEKIEMSGELEMKQLVADADTLLKKMRGAHLLREKDQPLH